MEIPTVGTAAYIQVLNQARALEHHIMLVQNTPFRILLLGNQYLEVTDEDVDDEEDVVAATDEPDQKEVSELNPMIGIITWSIAIAAIFFMLVSLF